MRVMFYNIFALSIPDESYSTFPVTCRVRDVFITIQLGFFFIKEITLYPLV
jgi:hypothetical protein